MATPKPTQTVEAVTLFLSSIQDDLAILKIYVADRMTNRKARATKAALFDALLDILDRVEDLEAQTNGGH